MTASVHGITIFCDDIRNEMGNKHSLMGCYGADLIVPVIPTLLPKLCAQISILVSPKDPPESLVARARLGEEVIGEISMPDGEAARVVQHISADYDDVEVIFLRVVMIFSPLSITEPSEIRIEIEADGVTSRGGRLKIRAREEDRATH
jgi:hypothetical protein